MKLNLKYSAIQILLAELQPLEIGAIYLMGSGCKEIPETVSKQILMNIITFLCERLGWIEEEKSPSTVTSFSEDSDTAIVVNDKSYNNVSEIRIIIKSLVHFYIIKKSSYISY